MDEMLVAEIIGIIIGSIVGGLAGGAIMGLLLKKVPRSKTVPGGIRAVVYIIGGFLLGIPGGMASEAILLAIEK